MWQLDNRTPFAAERTWVRDRDGTETWLVAVKCTFDIAPDGTTRIARDQPPVVAAPEYLDPARPATSSLKYDLDLVRTKLATDVIVHAQAHAPLARPVTELDIGVRVGPVVKRLRVTGDRVWQGRTASAPVPFVVMPIVYERAYGGFDPQGAGDASPRWDRRNPAGTGFASSMRGLGGLRLPNVEYADQCVRSWDDQPAPAGLGPIAMHWQPRAQLAGTYDDTWRSERSPLLTDDLDDRFYQCAPLDQQAPGFLSGGEPVTLINLTPAGRLCFDLPRVYLGLETFFHGGQTRVHDRPRLHTVILEPGVPRVALVWHSALACHAMVYRLSKTRIIHKPVVRGSVEQALPQRSRQ